jgi:hypothetical protein
MYRKILAASILAAALVGLTACAGPTAATTPLPNTVATEKPAAVKSTAPPTTKPVAPKPLTIAEAGKVYLAAVGPRNKTADKWNADVAAKASIKTLRADAVRARTAERHFLEALDRTLWPSIVTKNADNLATCTADFVSWFEQMTRIGSRSEVTTAPDCGGSDAQLIRARLNLSSETS